MYFLILFFFFGLHACSHKYFIFKVGFPAVFKSVFLGSLLWMKTEEKKYCTLKINKFISVFLVVVIILKKS